MPILPPEPSEEVSDLLYYASPVLVEAILSKRQARHMKSRSQQLVAGAESARPMALNTAGMKYPRRTF
jgi:hypothetical protein